MVAIDRIPVENRWRLATAEAMDLAMAYSAAVRETVGEAFGEALDEMEVEFWQRAGLEQVAIARAFGFPLRNAREVAEAFTTISILFQGPQLGVAKILDSGEDSIVIAMDACPALTRARKFRMDAKRVCMGCRAYSPGSCRGPQPRVYPCPREEHVHGRPLLRDCHLPVEEKGEEGSGRGRAGLKSGLTVEPRYPCATAWRPGQRAGRP